MAQPGPTIDRESYKRKNGPGGEQSKVVSSKSRQHFRNVMRTRAIVMLALQVAALVVAADPSRKDVNSLEYVEGKLTKAMDELDRRDTIGIYGDVITIEKIAEDEGEQPSEKSADPLVSRVEAFLRTRKIQINLPDDSSTAGLFGRALGRRSFDVELRSLTRGASEGKRRI